MIANRPIEDLASEVYRQALAILATVDAADREAIATAAATAFTYAALESAAAA